MNETAGSSRGWYVPVVVFAVALAGWTGAWLLNLALTARYDAFGNEWIGLGYWTAARLVVWIAPAVWLLRHIGVRVGEAFKVVSWRKTLAWGGGLGGAFMVVSLAVRIATGNWSPPGTSVSSWIDIVILAPLLEEFLMRGAILAALRRKMAFWPANVITAVLFLLLHVPGWFFLGSLSSMLTNPVGGALAIVLVGLACGLAAKRGEGLVAAILVHFLNNVY